MSTSKGVDHVAVVPVEVDGVTFYAEVADIGGPVNVGVGDVLAFDGVRQTVEVVSTQLVRAWETVRPDEATVEFGLKLKAKEGKLVGLLAGAEAEGSLKVTLKWRSGSAPLLDGETGPEGDPGESAGAA